MIRKTPTKVTVLEFTSMCPTMTMLPGIRIFITTKSVDFYDVCEEIRKLIDSINLTPLQNQEIWDQFVVLVQIQPDDDILPAWMNYTGYNSPFPFGINHIISTALLWHALSDNIGLKFLTGNQQK